MGEYKTDIESSKVRASPHAFNVAAEDWQRIRGVHYALLANVTPT